MIFYLSGAGAYCAFLLFNKFKDKECSKKDPISWLVVAIASSLWIVVIPLSIIELRTKATVNTTDKTSDFGSPENAPTYIETTV